MPGRPRRRAVGPPGAPPVRDEPRSLSPLSPLSPQDREGPPAGEDDDERLRADRPPHHDRGT